MAKMETAIEDFAQSARMKLEEYSSHTNQVLGISAFGTALACVGLKLSAGFAIFGLVFLLIAWADGIRTSMPYIRFLQRRKDPSVRAWAMLCRHHIAFIGWLFLGLVALGCIHS